MKSRSVAGCFGGGAAFGRLASCMATSPKRITGIPIPSPSPRPRARSGVHPWLEVEGKAGTTERFAGGGVGITATQRLAGDGTTCQTSPATGTIAHVVTPAHCVLAHSGKHAVCAVTGTPCRTYLHTVPGAQPVARLLDDANGKALSWTDKLRESVSLVKAVRAVIDLEPVGGDDVLIPSAKFVGYNTPAVML